MGRHHHSHSHRRDGEERRKDRKRERKSSSKRERGDDEAGVETPPVKKQNAEVAEKVRGAVCAPISHTWGGVAVCGHACRCDGRAHVFFGVSVSDGPCSLVRVLHRRVCICVCMYVCMCAVMCVVMYVVMCVCML